jgi:hypothetical protein
MHAVYPKFLTNISSADIIWSHFETTNSMQTVTARLPNNQKSWTWSFLAMAYWDTRGKSLGMRLILRGGGGNSKSKIFYKYKFL